MIYRETGQYKTSYQADQSIFPIRQDLYVIIAFVIFLYMVPWFATEYMYQVILLPLLIWGLIALGLNLMTGYTGLISLGTGGFMAVGAYSTFQMMTYFPWIPVPITFLFGGLMAAIFGVFIGLPSLRIKGFYLIVTTLAAQFFVEWLINGVDWLSDYSPSHTIGASPRTLFGFDVLGPAAPDENKYWMTLTIVIIMTLLAKNLVRGRIGRSWMAIRDMDIAAEIIGIRPLPNKLLSFAISSFYVGLGGSLYVMVLMENIDPEVFVILSTSFPVLFMIIIGGLGSIMGSYLGAAFITLVPVFLLNAPGWVGIQVDSYIIQHFQFILFGGLIIFFLIVEPLGLARLWQIIKEKLRLWPFPH